MSARLTHRKGASEPRVRISLPHRLRENLPLKIFAILLASILYFYVQSERNPTITRTFVGRIVRENQPEEVAIENEQQQMMVSVTGPRGLVERLKDDDIRAVADLRDVRVTEPTTTVARLRYVIQGQPPNPLLTIDPPSPPLQLRVFPRKTRALPVVVEFPEEPPAGQDYGEVKVTPKTIKFSGRSDRVTNVTRLVVVAVPAQSGERIDDDFPVSPRDVDGNKVEDLTLEKDTVHVTIPLVTRPPSKIVPVSPAFSALPVPPYRIEAITATPNQVRIIGRPERLAQIATIPTEEISLLDLTANQEMTVALVVPSDVAGQDMAGRPISRVQLKIRVRKSDLSSPPPASGGSGPSSSGARDNKPPETP